MMNKRKFGSGRGFATRGKGLSSRSPPPEKRSRRENTGNTSQGFSERRVRTVRDHLSQQDLEGAGAEKEFPRAWGLLHETMKTKFAVDKLDFSTTTLQLPGHEGAVYRCTVRLQKPRTFQATGEGYSSRVAESRCAAMACRSLREFGILPGGASSSVLSGGSGGKQWQQQEKDDLFDPSVPQCISISPDWQNKLFEAITTLPECGHFISYQRLAQYFGHPLKRKSLLQAPPTPPVTANVNGAPQSSAGISQAFDQPPSFGLKHQPVSGVQNDPRSSVTVPKPLFPDLTSGVDKSHDLTMRSHDAAKPAAAPKDDRPKKFELCLKQQSTGEESSFSLLLPPNVMDCFPSSQMIQCPNCSVWVNIFLRKIQSESSGSSSSNPQQSDNKYSTGSNRNGVGYGQREEQPYRQEQFEDRPPLQMSVYSTPASDHSFQSSTGSVQDTSHPGLSKEENEIYDVFSGHLYTAIAPSEAQDRCREMARSLSIIRATNNMNREAAARLPVAAMRSRIVNLSNEHQVVIIYGPPGSGKTTQVAQFLLEDYTDSGRGSYCNVVVAHPHRVVAMASAERISAERNEKLGDTVGYEVDVGYCVPTNSGRVMFCTSEVLLAKIRLNPLLMGVSHIIIDEANERRVHTDFLLAVVKQIIAYRRDLKVVVLTTSEQADSLSNYFLNMRYQQPAMCVEIPVDTPPVNLYYLDDVEQLLHRRSNMETTLDEGLGAVADVNVALVTRLILHITDTQLPGNILVILPGIDDILAVRLSLQNSLLLEKGQLNIVLLHSKLAVTEVQKVHQRGMVQMRKVILADSLGETSVSVENVSYVICSGKRKVYRFDPVKKMSALVSTWCSRVSIDHQCHHADAAKPCGTCYCLFSKRNHQEMSDRPVAEMHHVSLERVALLSKILYPNMAISEMLSKVIEPPPVMSVTLAINNLAAMGALDDKEKLTPLGIAMASLSTEPQIGKMLLLAATFGVIEPVLTVASWFDCSDPFVLDDVSLQQQIEGRLKYVATTNSDHLALVNAYNGWMHAQFSKSYADSHCLHMGSLLMIKGLKEHFTSEMLGLDIGNPELFNRHASSEHMVKATLCAGMYPNLLRYYRSNRGGQWGRSQMETKLDGTVNNHPLSVGTLDTQPQCGWFVFHQKVMGSGILVNDCTIIDPVVFLLFAGNVIEVVQQDGDEVLISLDGDEWLVFRTMAITADILDATRRGLQTVVDHFITTPSTSTASNVPQPYIAFTKCVCEFLDDNPCTTASNKSHH